MNRNVHSISSTRAKNEFGSLLERAMQGQRIVITKHDAPKAVLISYEDFHHLVGDASAQLDTLSAEFDAMLARMQLPRAKAGLRRAFDASPEELGKAAVKAARPRG
ncbi:MAG: type II toxin-antitoxin system Phd/YefM family antitoxin [Armatimonadetes bacterium]|nr:type II toxin-antitoxin system Phd/YefM family antitoxin [Armatimonadota bacterium]